MAASFPASVKNFGADRVDGEYIPAADMNDVRAEVVAIETLLLNKKRTTASFDKTSDTTLANITGLSVNVLAGKIYKFEATLYCTSNVGGGVKFSIGGTATATAVIFEGLTIQGTITQGRSSVLGSPVGQVTAVTQSQTIIRGTINVNAGGALTVQFAQNASNGAASSVLAGSTFEVENIL